MTNIENEFWEGMNGMFPDIIKAITSLSSKSYVSITNLKTGVTWWSQRARDYFHLDDNYIIRGKEKGSKMIHPDDIDIFIPFLFVLRYGQQVGETDNCI